MTRLRLIGLFLAFTSFSVGGCGRSAPSGPVADAEAAKKIRITLVSNAATSESGAGAKKAAAEATGWGTIKGRFVFDGKAPTPAALDTSSKPDPACSKHALFDESLVVGGDGGLSNVTVWVRTKDVPVHPDYEKTASDKVVLDNKGCRFVPHVLAMRTTQTLELKNSDETGHNTNASGLMANSPFNPVLSKLTSSEQKLPLAEPSPAAVTCTIHPWMKGYLLVQAHPYFAITGKDGTFEIKNVPAGVPLDFQVWHEAAGGNGAVKVDRADLKWQNNGRFSVTLQPDQTLDLKDLKVPASALSAG